MVELLVALIVAYVLVKAGLALINDGTAEVVDESKASEERMIEYRAWLNGDGRVAKNGCLEPEHSPMVLFNQEDPTRIDCVICSICSDTLPRPAKYSCGQCSFTTVDGYILEDLCNRHKEKVLS